MAYEYTNKKGTPYFLHQKEVELKGNHRKQTIYYFAKDTRMEGIDDVPEGYMVIENEKTGLPVLKRS